MMPLHVRTILLQGQDGNATMTHVWFDRLVKVAVATEAIAFLALAAGMNLAVAAATAAPADRSAPGIPVMVPAAVHDHRP